ncbi:MAG: hypothetical protein KAT85_07505, partial [candidate division Zixibacteria bacterium]|nr:hypothetical protein [candidate division Zixibacteria bacterium]
MHIVRVNSKLGTTLKTAAITLSVVAVVVICSCIRANDSAYHRLGPIEDPSTLPFRFHIDREMPVFASDGSPTTGRFVVTTSCSTDKLRQYVVINNWRPADTSSAIVFYADLDLAEALRHVNVRTRDILSDHFGDFDGDGHCEVAVTYSHNDSLWLDFISYRTGLLSHLLLLAGVDRDGNGYWDGRAFILASEDFNGDGRDELLLSTDVGYDLYPRELICVDITHQDILWRFAHSGIVADRNFQIVHPDTMTAPLLVVGIGSKGNAAVAGDMNDQHSYLLVIDADGDLLWKRVLGPAFSRATPVVFDYQSDGTLEIIVPWRNCSENSHRDRTVLGVFSMAGD